MWQADAVNARHCDSTCREVPKPGDVTDDCPGGGTTHRRDVLTLWCYRGAMGSGMALSDRLRRRDVGGQRAISPAIFDGARCGDWAAIIGPTPQFVVATAAKAAADSAN